jgi:hypothetical protein
MSLERRQCERSEIILVVMFRVAKKSLDYFHGITRNFSNEGLSFEYHNCNLQPGDILDIKLKHPNRDLLISAMGEILWEKGSDFTREAGMKLWVLNREAKRKLTELGTLYREMPWDSFYYGKDSETGPTYQKEELTLGDLHKLKQRINELARSDNGVIDTTGDDEGIESSTINSVGSYGLNVGIPQTIESRSDKDQATASHSVEIKGRRGAHQFISSLAKVFIVTVLAMVIITFEDINNTIPEVEMQNDKEMEHENMENLSATKTFEKGLETDEELGPSEVNTSINKSDKFVDTIIAHEPHSSEKTYGIQRGSFFNIGRFVIAGSIGNKEPIGIVNAFSSSTEKAYCFLEARDITEDTAINLVWFHNYNKVATVELPIKKGVRWRTHSSKRLMGLRGIWKVELQDLNGTVLETIAFMVK